MRTGSVAFVVIEWLQIEIYSMRKGCWKFITQRFPSHVKMIFEHNYVCVDGHDGHFHGSGHIAEEGEPQTIVVFDLGSETFFEMPLPDSLPILEGKHIFDLGVLGGKLCVMSYRRFGNEGIDVWVMDEYGVADDSWVKRHAFCFSEFCAGAFIGFTSHNEFMYRNADDDLVFYDPVADKAKIVGKSCRGKYRANRIVEYIHNLVWVAPSLP